MQNLWTTLLPPVVLLVLVVAAVVFFPTLFLLAGRDLWVAVWASLGCGAVFAYVLRFAVPADRVEQRLRTMPFTKVALAILSVSCVLCVLSYSSSVLRLH